MNMSITAEELYAEMERMPSSERTRFFLLLAAKAFREVEEDYTHEQVFGVLHREPFSVPEAAEYLEVSVPTLRRYVQSGKLRPIQVIGRSQLFDASDLRSLKRSKEIAGRC